MRLGRIIRFLSPMDWGSKSSKALGLDAVLRIFGGSTVARLFFFKASRGFSSRMEKCFAWAGFRGTGFGASNDRLDGSSAHDGASPFFLEKVDLKGASFVDEPELEFRQCLDAPSS